MSDERTLNQLTLFAEDSPAKTSQWLDDALDWLADDPACSGSCVALLKNFARAGLSSKTCPAFCRPADVTSAVPLAESCGFTPGSGNGKPKSLASALSALPLRECLEAIAGATSPPSWEGWQTSGMGGRSVSLTLNTSDWPSDGSACSLSQVLETEPVPPKFFLSPTACRGILRRAEKRGKKLPEALAVVLESVAGLPIPTG